MIRSHFEQLHVEIGQFCVSSNPASDENVDGVTAGDVSQHPHRKDEVQSRSPQIRIVFRK
jgi:hypothetical protein